MEEGLGRRAFLGVAAAAPLVAPMAGQMAQTAMVEVGPTGPSPLGAFVSGSYGLDAAKEAVGIGPWLKTALTESVWKAKRAEERRLSMLLDTLGYTPDHSIEPMKSWSPSFKFAMQRVRREEIAALRLALGAELWPDRYRDNEY